MDALIVDLTNDCAKTIDRQFWNQFKQTPLQVQATGGTSNSAVTLFVFSSVNVTNNVAMTLAHVRGISNLMKTRSRNRVPVHDHVDVVLHMRTDVGDLAHALNSFPGSRAGPLRVCAAGAARDHPSMAHALAGIAEHFGKAKLHRLGENVALVSCSRC